MRALDWADVVLYGIHMPSTNTCIHCDKPVEIDNDLNDGWPFTNESGGFWCDSDDAVEGRHDTWGRP